MTAPGLRSGRLPGVNPDAPLLTETARASYGRILHSTALMGGVSVLKLGVAVVRSKAIAVMLGPTGMALNGIYESIIGLTETVAGLGINSSGVREIANAARSHDQSKVAKTAAVLRWTSLALGVAGAVALAGFSTQVSSLTFGNEGQATAISILGLGVVCRLASAGQGALLQGMRRMGDLARFGVLSSVVGTAATIVLVYLLRERGIAPAVTATAAVTLLVSWWYSHHLRIATCVSTVFEVRTEVRALLQLGTALMFSSLITLGCGYAIRAGIFRQLGAESTGLYQAAWTMGGSYVSFILQAMGSDFYPRLTTVAHENSECNRLVNEQTRVSLLLAGSGVIGTITFSTLVITIFYASNFQGAAEILRWISLGAALQVVSWPLGFIVVAKGAKATLVCSELAWAAVHLGLAWIGLRRFGLPGAGMAFFGSYVFHMGLTYIIAGRLSGFHWTTDNRRALVGYVAIIGAVFYSGYVLPPLWAMAFGSTAMVMYGIYSMRTLAAFIPTTRLPPGMQRLIARAHRWTCISGE